MRRLIAFSGKMGSGKSTAIEMLKKLTSHEVILVKFADPLYAIQRFMYEQINMPVPLPKDRKLLQWIGTEWGRSKDPNLWVNLWRHKVRFLLERNPTSIVVCDDCRFDNEAETVKAMGGTIVQMHTSDHARGERIQLEGTAHASEAGINPEFVDTVVTNNGSKEELEAQVRKLLE